MSLPDKVLYWIDLAYEDIDTAKGLFSLGKYLHSGFFMHLAVEKALKSILENKGETPPKIHNLIKLAEMGDVIRLMSNIQIDLLAGLNPLQIEARYPSYKQAVKSTLTQNRCENLLCQAEEVIQWIEKQL